MRFILIDRLTALEPGIRAEAHKIFDPSDDIFADHFPDLPIVPGVLLTEAMGQTAGWLLVVSEQFKRWPLLTMIRDGKFRRPVRPGEAITLTAELRAQRPRYVEVAADARVAGHRVASARLMFHLFDVPAEGGRFDRWARSTYEALGGPALVPLPTGD